MRSVSSAWHRLYEPIAEAKKAVSRDYISDLGGQATDIGSDIGLDPSGIHNGAMDAVRHAYGASRLSETFGSAPTEFAGLVREIIEFMENAPGGVKGAAAEFVMDVLNNKVRVGMGSSTALDLYFALVSGKLTVIDHDGSLRSTDARDIEAREWDGIDVEHERSSPEDRLDHDFGGDDRDTYNV